MADKLVCELAPGDDIRVLKPSGRARVIALTDAPHTTVRRYGAGPGEQPGLAVIIDFEYRDEPRAGVRDYVYQHPRDRVQLA